MGSSQELILCIRDQPLDPVYHSLGPVDGENQERSRTHSRSECAKSREGSMTSVIDMMVDVSEPRIVEIQIRSDGKVVWVNVDGICRFRACKVKKLEVQDERKG
jgi:hypothetical protein